MKLKRGIQIFLSERGHNGFFYPSKKSLELVEDIDAKVLSWIGGGDKVAITIPETTKARCWVNTVTVTGPVWIDRSDIDKS
mgnify:CR=1 FL=1|tara:strand:- start:562 stop:804 length:243 start_codon:yes stop_codon:yes gene_type:complete